MWGSVIFDHWTQQSDSILWADAYGNAFKRSSVSVYVGCLCAVHLEFSPGGVHASTEDWTNTDRLLEGIGIFLSLYFAKAAWTASVCKSKRTREQRLDSAKKGEHKSFKSLGQYGRMITRSEALIPGVGWPGLVVFWTWEDSLRGRLDPVVNLQRRIYTCRQMEPKKVTN